MTASDKEMRDPRRDEVIAGEYVLGVLSADDRRKVEARLAEDRQFAAIVNRWEENLSTFNDDYEALQPPPRAYSAIEQRILGTVPDAALSGRVAGGFWNSLVLWRSLAFASLAIAAGFGLLISAMLAPRPVSGGRLVADLAGEGSAINLVARYDEADGALRITPVAAGGGTEKSLELWLVEDGRAPVSLGVLPQTGEGELAIPTQMRARLVQGAVLAVSLEPFGGSPTGSATGPVIASGATRFE